MFWGRGLFKDSSDLMKLSSHRGCYLSALGRQAGEDFGGE